MKYSIEFVERKTTSTGKPMIKATIKDEAGNRTDNVAIWSSFPNFATLTNGQIVEGDLKVEQKGNYTNATLSPSASGKPVYGAYKANPGAITKAMERKEQSIEKFQDNKELSIKVSSTMRDAVLLAVAEHGKGSQYDLDHLVVKWRGWLWLQWDKTSPNDLNPF